MLLTLGMLLGMSGLFAQQVVTGTVTSAVDGAPIEGATVLLKGTTTGSFTDTEGRFTLSVPNLDGTIVVSFFGFSKVEVPMEGKTSFSIALSSDFSIDEVVVVGYGTQKQKEITSAISSVDAESFNKGTVNDVSQLLQGKVAGLTITRPGGDPNGGFAIRLRGLSTVGANTSPLIVIDGVIGADINSVDPNDIASMDVLKDGSAAAIYGTRGSAGVILITTKSGKSGRATLEYNGTAAIEQIARTPDAATAEEFRQLISEGTIAATDLGQTTDWYDEISRDAFSQVHNIALSGGTPQTSYRVSLNLRDAQGVAINTGFNQLNGRINLTQKALNDRLKVTMNLAATNRVSQFGFREAFRYAAIYNPTAPVFSTAANDIRDYDGYFQQTLFDYFNPVAILEQNINEGKLNRTNIAIEGDYRIADGLNFVMRYGQQRDSYTGGRYFDKQSFWRGRDRDGLAEVNADFSYNRLFESTLTYSKSFGQLDFAALGGYSFQEFMFDGFSMSGGRFLTDAFRYHRFGASLEFPNGLGTVNSYRNDYRVIGAFGRLTFNYDGTYFVNLSARREGSSRFGINNRWGWFPAASAGVTLSNLISVSWINNLKARVSYGVTGSLPGDSYRSLATYGPTGSNFFFNGEFVPSYGPQWNDNPDLQWETKAEIDFGVDYSLFDDRLYGSLDYYVRTTTNLIWAATVPQPPNQAGTTFLNTGELRSRGFEATVNYQVAEKSNFSWTTGLNIATFAIDLISLSNETYDFGGFVFTANMGSPGQNNTPITRAEEGAPLGLIWGLQYDGIDENGNYKFVDQNADGKIDTEDETVIGNGLPKAELGWSNSFTFGNFDLNFFFRGVFGHDLLNSYRGFYEAPQAGNSYNVILTKYWDEEGLDALTANPAVNSLHVEAADFLQLNNATIGYRIPVASRTGIQNVRLFLSGQNLFYISGYTGVDPEVRFTDLESGNLLAPGIDRRDTWARTRIITFGVNLGL